MSNQQIYDSMRLIVALSSKCVECEELIIPESPRVTNGEKEYCLRCAGFIIGKFEELRESLDGLSETLTGQGVTP